MFSFQVSAFEFDPRRAQWWLPTAGKWFMASQSSPMLSHWCRHCLSVSARCSALSIASRLYHRGNARFTVREGGGEGWCWEWSGSPKHQTYTVSLPVICLQLTISSRIWETQDEIKWGGNYGTFFNKQPVKWLILNWFSSIAIANMMQLEFDDIGRQKQTDD